MTVYVWCPLLMCKYVVSTGRWNTYQSECELCRFISNFLLLHLCKRLCPRYVETFYWNILLYTEVTYPLAVMNLMIDTWIAAAKALRLMAYCWYLQFFSSLSGPGESEMRPWEAWIGPQEAHHWRGLDEPLGSSIGVPRGLIGALGSLNRALRPWGSDEASLGLDWNLGGLDGVSGVSDRAWKYKDWASKG